MRFARFLLLLSVDVYLACLPLDAFCVAGRCSDWPGYAILLFGVLVSGEDNVAWFANPLLFAGWIAILRDRRWPAVALTVVATGVAASFLLVKTVVTNEGGIANPVTGYATGYWVWLISLVLAVAAAVAVAPASATQGETA